MPAKISEEAEGNAKAKGKGTGKRKVPRAAAEAVSNVAHELRLFVKWQT